MFNGGDGACICSSCIEHGYDLAQSYYQRAQVYGALGDSEHQNSDLQESLKAAS